MNTSLGIGAVTAGSPVAVSGLSAIKRTARVAGALYFLTIGTGFMGLVYVPSKLVVRGDATATAANIRASVFLLRLGIASELFGQIALVYAVLVLYRLFKPVNESQARQLLVLGALVSAPILFVNVLNEFAALLLVSGNSYLAVFDKAHLDALAYFFMRLHGRGFVVAEIFWGLWLFPFGALVIRCGFIPRFLGVLLLIAGLGYVADSIVSLLLPQFEDVVHSTVRLMEQGEPPIIFWLLIWGARLPASRT
jgi:Domain of unknown function (DUF4386)